jgi:hypothetical protein
MLPECEEKSKVVLFVLLFRSLFGVQRLLLFQVLCVCEHQVVLCNRGFPSNKDSDATGKEYFGDQKKNQGGFFFHKKEHHGEKKKQSKASHLFLCIHIFIKHCPGGKNDGRSDVFQHAR